MKISPSVKKEFESFLHTFLAIFVVTVLPLLENFDWDNANKAAFSALGIAIVRSMVKATSEKLRTVDSQQ
jgi:hypothetical protein